MDLDLRELEQKVKQTPDDKVLEYKFRLTAVREGKPELAKPLKVNDEVLVTEASKDTDSPWINGSWRGKISKINEDNSVQVIPLGDWSTLDFRVRPNDSYLKEGIYLSAMQGSNDVESLQLLMPAMVD